MIGIYIILIIDLKIYNNIYNLYTIMSKSTIETKKQNQMEANKRYRAKNRESYNAYMKEYQKNRYKNDPEAKERLRTQQRKYVARKRAEKLEAKSTEKSAESAEN